jgi:hypothetical protein
MTVMIAQIQYVWMIHSVIIPAWPLGWVAKTISTTTPLKLKRPKFKNRPRSVFFTKKHRKKLKNTVVLTTIFHINYSAFEGVHLQFCFWNTFFFGILVYYFLNSIQRYILLKNKRATNMSTAASENVALAAPQVPATDAAPQEESSWWLGLVAFGQTVLNGMEYVGSW